MTLTPLRRWIAVLALAGLAGPLTACTAGSTDGRLTGGSTTGTGTPTGTTITGTGGTATPPGVPATPTGAATTTTGAATTPPTDTRPVVGNVELSLKVRCSYVPHGNLDGSDGLTVFAYILLIGANALPGPISTAMSISNGYS